MFDSHRDFGWISREITYGLYLSDHRILDGNETELVVLSGIMAQDLPRMTGQVFPCISQFDDADWIVV